MARKPFIRALVVACTATAVIALPGAARAGLVSGLLGGVTNVALPSCSSLSQPFAQFGDYSNYYPIPNQGLESGSTGWTLTGGAAVVAGNEPWHVGGAGTSSLALPPGASATSPATCVNLLSPHVRMFADGAAAGGPLQVQVIFRGLTGNLLGIVNYGTFQPGDYPSWQPSGWVSSLLALPLVTSSVQLKVTSLATAGGAWQVDDVYVDPFRMG